MSVLNLSAQTSIILYAFALLIHALDFAHGTAVDFRRCHLDSQIKSAAFVSKVFVPIVKEREAAHNPIGQTQGLNPVVSSATVPYLFQGYRLVSGTYSPRRCEGGAIDAREITEQGLPFGAKLRKAMSRADEGAAGMRHAVHVSPSYVRR